MAHASIMISKTAEGIGMKFGGHEEEAHTKLPSKFEHSRMSGTEDMLDQR